MTRIKQILIVLLCAGNLFLACKNKSAKDNNDTKTDTVTNTTTTPPPVEVQTDDALKNGVKDATKDYPKVTASVANGEITLTGEIARDRLSNLMQSLNALHPKKINNNLVIK